MNEIDLPTLLKRKDQEIFELRERLEQAHRRQDELQRAHLTIKNVIYKRLDGTQMILPIIATYSYPEGITVIVGGWYE